VGGSDGADEGPPGAGTAPPAPPAAPEAPRRSVAVLRELHENRELARLFEMLPTYGLSIDDWGLVQEESVTGAKLPTKYAWELSALPSERRGEEAAADAKEPSAAEPADEPGDADDTAGPSQAGPSATRPGKLVEAANLPAIIHTLHEVGRRGLEIKRFKGLGEMDAEQLWDTMMDPARRTLMRVAWDGAAEADTLFSILMGEAVEARRRFIEEHALEVKNLDV